MGKIWKINPLSSKKLIAISSLSLLTHRQTSKGFFKRGHPWLFDGYIMAMKSLESHLQQKMVVIDSEAFWVQHHDLPLMCMNRFYGNLIGKSIGRVLDVDVEVDDVGWGRLLRVRIEISLNKALASGRLITVKGENCWISFKYEKFPRICFCCGKISHSEDCKLPTEKTSTIQYGSWLRAKTCKKGSKDPGLSWSNQKQVSNEQQKEPPQATRGPEVDLALQQSAVWVKPTVTWRMGICILRKLRMTRLYRERRPPGKASEETISPQRWK